MFTTFYLLLDYVLAMLLSSILSKTVIYYDHLVVAIQKLFIVYSLAIIFNWHSLSQSVS